MLRFQFVNQRRHVIFLAGFGAPRTFDQAICDTAHRRHHNHDLLPLAGRSDDFCRTADAACIANGSSAEFHNAKRNTHYQWPRDSIRYFEQREFGASGDFQCIGRAQSQRY